MGHSLACRIVGSMGLVVRLVAGLMAGLKFLNDRWQPCTNTKHGVRGEMKLWGLQF